MDGTIKTYRLEFSTHSDRYLEVQLFQPYCEMRDADDFDSFDPELAGIALVAFGHRKDLSMDTRGGGRVPHCFRSLEGSKLGRYVNRAIEGKEASDAPCF